MIHFHGTPITPIEALYELAGRNFCVSYMDPRDIERCHAIGSSVMIDNGEFTFWKRRLSGKTAMQSSDYRTAYYAFTDRWLDYPTTWAIPSDAIDTPSQEQDALLNEWPHGKRQAAPVYHLDEPVSRLLRLCDAGWNRVCMGSTAEYRVVLSEAWERRMDELWDALAQTFGRTPPIHMLRGLQCSGRRWPFASADSTDIAQNHHLPQHTPRSMADRWDAVQCPGRWIIRGREQLELVA